MTVGDWRRYKRRQLKKYKPKSGLTQGESFSADPSQKGRGLEKLKEIQSGGLGSEETASHGIEYKPPKEDKTPTSQSAFRDSSRAMFDPNFEPELFKRELPANDNPLDFLENEPVAMTEPIAETEENKNFETPLLANEIVVGPKSSKD
eukprot:UN25979